MKTGNLTSTTDFQEIVGRINALTPNTQPQWGKMNVNQMVVHITDPFRDILGDRQTKPVVPSLLQPIVRMMLLGKKPFQKMLPP